jgi:hypothetical protein
MMSISAHMSQVLFILLCSSLTLLLHFVAGPSPFRCADSFLGWLVAVNFHQLPVRWTCLVRHLVRLDARMDDLSS